MLALLLRKNAQDKQDKKVKAHYQNKCIDSSQLHSMHVKRPFKQQATTIKKSNNYNKILKKTGCFVISK